MLTTNIVHTAIADNKKITLLNKIYCKTKNNRFKLRHAPYSNRWQQGKEKQCINNNYS